MVTIRPHELAYKPCAAHPDMGYMRVCFGSVHMVCQKFETFICSQLLSYLLVKTSEYMYIWLGPLTLASVQLVHDKTSHEVM